MSGHRLPKDWLSAPFKVSDPGASGTVNLDNKGFAVVGITTVAAESRTIPAPDAVNQVVTVYLDTDGGNCTVTITGGQGVSSVVLDDAGDAFTLVSISVAGTAKWIPAWASGPLSGFQSTVSGGKPWNIATWQAVAATSGTDTACSNGTAYVGSVFIPANTTITGIQYLVGSVGGTDKVVASLHDSSGTLLANSATAGATVGTAAQVQQVAFTAPYVTTGPGWYFIALTFNGTTAKFRSVPAHTQNGVVGNGVTQTFGTPASFTAPTTFTADKVPIASCY